MLLRYGIAVLLMITTSHAFAYPKSNWTIYKTWSPSNQPDTVFYFVFSVSAEGHGDGGVGLWVSNKTEEAPHELVEMSSVDFVSTPVLPDQALGDFFVDDNTTSVLVGHRGPYGLIAESEGNRLFIFTATHLYQFPLNNSDSENRTYHSGTEITVDDVTYEVFGLSYRSKGRRSGRELYDIFAVRKDNGSPAYLGTGNIVDSNNNRTTTIFINKKKLTAASLTELFQFSKPVPEPLEHVAPQLRDKEEADAKGTAEPPPINKPVKKLIDTRVKDQEGDLVSAIQLIGGFTRNLTKEFKAHPVTNVDIDSQLRDKVQKGLLKRERKNVMVLGAAGTGKTTQVEALVSEMVNSSPVDEFRNVHYLEVDLAALAAGTNYVGTFETNINAMKALSRINNIVWVIDEFHSVRGMGAHKDNSNDIFELIKGDLTNGKFRVIGMSTIDEFWAAFEGDTAASERFTIFTKAEPQGEDLLKILRNWLARFELAVPSQEVLEEIVRISTEMNPIGAQPRKSVSLLEEIYATLRLKGTPQAQPERKDVLGAAKDLYQTDVDILDPSTGPARLERLKQHLDAMVVGQTAAKEALVEETKQILTDLHDKGRPRVRALLTGPKGRGKTELAIAYAEGMGLPYEVIEMNAYATAQGFDRTGLMEALANALKTSAFKVLILDEIEKAPIALQNELLKMLNNGEFNLSVRLKSGSSKMVNRRIASRNATVFMTSNAGSTHILKSQKRSIGFIDTEAVGASKSQESALEDFKGLKAQLEADNISDTVLDRMQLILPFEDQTSEDFQRVLLNHLERALAQIHAVHRDLKVNIVGKSEFARKMAELHFSPDMSNRDALRVIQSSVRQVLADHFIGKPLHGTVDLSFDGGKFVFSCAAKLGKVSMKKNKRVPGK